VASPRFARWCVFFRGRERVRSVRPHHRGPHPRRIDLTALARASIGSVSNLHITKANAVKRGERRTARRRPRSPGCPTALFPLHAANENDVPTLTVLWLQRPWPGSVGRSTCIRGGLVSQRREEPNARSPASFGAHKNKRSCAALAKVTH
jgi:hypothetical protein